MKLKTLAVVLATIALTACNKAPSEAAAPATAPTNAAPQEAPLAAMPATATAEGTVSSTDAAGGKITIAHGPVPALNWPGMTMPFKAKPEQISAVKSGDRVEFEFETKDYALTRISVKQ
jgi:Cu(I)/Ag(I) efflux system protein CusF